MTKRTRKQYSPEEKVKIIRLHLLEKRLVSDICDEYKLQPTVFYRWQKQFFEQGAAAFSQNKNRETEKLKKKIATLEAKAIKKNEVLSELMEAHIDLKKNLGEL